MAFELQGENGMQAVYQPADLLEANMLVAMLQGEGISAHIHGANLVGAMGELPALGLLSIWVEDGQVERAARLIRDYTGAQPCADEYSEATGEEQLLGGLWC